MIKNIAFAVALFSTVATSVFAGDLNNSNSSSNAAANTSTSTTSQQGQDQGQTQSTSSSSTSNQSTSASQGNSQNITFNSPNKVKETLNTTPVIAAPSLTTTLTETCLGSATGGLSVVGFGMTGGKTYVDKACVRRLNAREIAQTLGDRDAAREIMCGDAEVNAAYKALGRACLSSPKK